MGEQVVTEMYGKYGELAQRGLVYAARSASATIPAYTTLTNAPVLWNPAGSNKLIVPLKVMLTPTGLGTPIITGLIACFLANAGATAATAAPVLTFTPIASYNCLIGMGSAAKGLFAAAVVTYTTQPQAFLDLGLGLWKSGTDAISLPITQVFDFDSMVMMPPSTLIAIGGFVATSVTYCLCIIWAEIPMVAI
jgi:hypothetical protein